MGILINPYRFVPTGNTDLILEVDTTKPGSASDTFILSLFNGATYNFNIDWGDGTDNDYNSSALSSVSHTYSTGGVYELKISGSSFPRIYFNFTGDVQKLIKIKQWGNSSWTSMEAAFFGCINLSVTASDSPDLSGVTSMSSMFRNCGALTASSTDFDAWDTSNITDMSYLFRASGINTTVGSWNVGNVTNLLSMFREANSFNFSLSGWNVSSVTDFRDLFRSNNAFDQSLGAWNIQSATNMTGFMQSASGLSAANYNSTLIGWDGLTSTPSNIIIDMGGSTYGPCPSAACTARDNLVNTYNWTITDGGAVP